MRKKYNKVVVLSIFASAFISFTSFAQVGVGNIAPASTLDITATNPTGVTTNVDGILIPRVTRQRAQSMTAIPTATMVYISEAITGTAAGTTVDVTSEGFYFYNGTKWVASGSDKNWSLIGNTATATSFVGTTNSQPLRLFSNNVERFRINPVDGEIVAGALSSPYAGDALNAVSTTTLPFGLNGYSAQNGSGTWGEVLAASTTAFSAVQGVYGGSGAGSGVLGNYNGTNVSNTRAGVTGICSTGTANNGGAGVVGNNNIASGAQRMGVLGIYNASAFGIGTYGIGFGGGIITGNNDIGIVGWRANNQNYSGYFNGNHVIANGTKSASVGTSKGNQLLYVTETPGVWFEDIGRGKLENGYVKITLDPLFLETVFIDDKHPISVFLQEEGDSKGLFVIPQKDGFIVKEKQSGNSNIEFSYRIMAKRLHFQDHRFGNDTVWGEGDTRKYSYYAIPPPVNYEENIKFQAAQKKNYKPTPMPKGFITYETLQEETKKLELSKAELKR